MVETEYDLGQGEQLGQEPKEEFRSNEGGAAMLETSLVIICFMILLGAVLDLGVALYQYGMLRHTTNQAARDVTVELAMANFNVLDRCQRFRDVTCQYLGGTPTNLMSQGGTNTALVSWNFNMSSSGPSLRLFQLHSDIPVNCFFLCRFFGTNWHLQANSTVSVDSASVPTCFTSAPFPAC